MTRASLAAAILLFGCPSDDEWQDSLDDSSSTAASASASASATATDDTTGTGSPTATGSDTTTSASTTTGDATTDADTTSGDSTTGTGECGADLEPSEFTEVDGCALVGEPRCSEGTMHVPQDSEVDWQSDPPASGPHYPTWYTWAVHSDPVPRGNWVHNLEHGGIVLLHRCDEPCDAELAVLEQVFTDRPELRVLVTPDPLLPGERFAAVSWTWVYRFDVPDLDTLLCFADQHENHAPEDVP